MILVTLNMGRSAVNCQGIVREFHNVWTVVTLPLLLFQRLSPNKKFKKKLKSKSVPQFYAYCYVDHVCRVS